MSTLLVLLLVVCSLPFVTYVCIKLGTYAFFKGRQAYYEEKENDE